MTDAKAFFSKKMIISTPPLMNVYCEMNVSIEHFLLLFGRNVKNRLSDNLPWLLESQRKTVISLKLCDFELISHFRYDKRFLMFYALGLRGLPLHLRKDNVNSNFLARMILKQKLGEHSENGIIWEFCGGPHQYFLVMFYISWVIFR